MSRSDVVVNGLYQVPASLEGQQLFSQLPNQPVCRIFTEELVWFVLDQGRYLCMASQVKALSIITPKYLMWSFRSK